MKYLDANNPDDYRTLVWLNGKDVSSWCTAAYAPDAPGTECPSLFKMLNVDSNGQRHTVSEEDGEAFNTVICQSWKYGVGKWEPMPMSEPE